MKKNTTIAAAVATLLIAGGAVLAGEGVEIEQKPFDDGNWQAQNPLRLGSDVEQSDPYGDGWSAQDPLRLGSDVEQDDPYGNGWRPQDPMQLTNRQRAGREAPRLARLCNSRMIRLVFEVRGIELDCP